MPEEPKPIEDKEPQTAQIVRTLVQQIADGKADANQFTPELKAKLFPDAISGIGDYMKELGDLKSLDLLTRGEEGDQRSYKYRASFEHMDLFLSLQLTKDNKIAALHFSTE
jgi:hypothetical protein